MITKIRSLQFLLIPAFLLSAASALFHPFGAVKQGGSDRALLSGASIDVPPKRCLSVPVRAVILSEPSGPGIATRRRYRG
jgi:hypothetical protein